MDRHSHHTGRAAPRHAGTGASGAPADATVRGFPPVARADARLLILGSMPGEASLAAGEYYAHPRNQFWAIVGTLLGFDAGAPYMDRIGALQRAGVAVWDVLAACTRPGSLDADIDRRSVITNDFGPFFATHQAITDVFFNGTTAADCFRRHVQPSTPMPAMRYHRLPSTSPAHAGMNMAAKLSAWQIIADALRRR